VEVVDDGAAPEVEEDLAGAAIAGTAPLPTADVSEGMLDGDALAELGTASGCGLTLAQLDEATGQRTPRLGPAARHPFLAYGSDGVGAPASVTVGVTVGLLVAV
jgi:hypothetical protein